MQDNITFGDSKMPKLKIQHKNQLDAIITDGFLMYEYAFEFKEGITDFYRDDELIARIKGNFATDKLIELDDTTDKESEDLVK